MNKITHDDLRNSIRKQLTEWVFDHVCGSRELTREQAEHLVNLHHELEHCDDEHLVSTAKFLTTFGAKIYNPNVLAVNAGILRVTR